MARGLPLWGFRWRDLGASGDRLGSPRGYGQAADRSRIADDAVTLVRRRAMNFAMPSEELGRGLRPAPNQGGRVEKGWLLPKTNGNSSLLGPVANGKNNSLTQG